MIYLKHIKTGRYFTGTTLHDRGAIQNAIFTDNVEQALEYISYQEAGEVAKTIEVPVEVAEE